MKRAALKSGKRQKQNYKLAEEPKVTIWCQTDWLMEKEKSGTIYIFHEVARNVEDSKEPIPNQSD
jgi:hypothetical protein